MDTIPIKLLIENCDQIVQVCANKELVKKGKFQDELAILSRRKDGMGCSIAIGCDGNIVEVGYDDELSYSDVNEFLDGSGCALIPGLIDAHTHPIWAGDRVFEFDMKMRGDSYLDIHKRGGGIYYTVEETLKASEDELLKDFTSRLDNMLRCGSTMIECKTGYALQLDGEVKMLNVIERARQTSQVDLVTTFLGGHARMRDMSADESVECIIEMTKEIGKMKKHKIDFVDVFCETGVFDTSQSRHILLAGKEYLNAQAAFHGDELTPIGAAEMAATVGAKSVSHLEFVSEKGIKCMSENDIVATICPTTAFLLKLQSPPARRMIDANVAIAIGSDFNPNAFCYSLPMTMNLAVIKCGMTLNEALVACTINSACALHRSHSFGSLETGKVGDCVMVDASDWRHLIYQFGDTRHIIKHVIKRGQVIF